MSWISIDRLILCGTWVGSEVPQSDCIRLIFGIVLEVGGFLGYVNFWNLDLVYGTIVNESERYG
jgi:hypothetical protein